MSPIAESFLEDFTESFINNIQETIKRGYQGIWNALISFLINNWLLILILLIAVFIVAVIVAFSRGPRLLYKVIYNYLYFGIIFIIGLVYGSDIFVNNYFSLICIIVLYPACYLLTRLISEKIGIKK